MSQKPILIGGIAISVIFWLATSLAEPLKILEHWTILGAIAFGLTLVLLPKPNSTVTPTNITVNELEVQKAIASCGEIISLLETESPSVEISPLKQLLTQLPAELNRKELQVAITGGKKVGKSSLKALLHKLDNISLIETEALFTNQQTPETLFAADIVLFLINGDLTDSEWQIIQQLKAYHQRLLLIFNKQDIYLPEQSNLILQQLRYRTEKLLSKEDIIGVSCSPNLIKVRQHKADGTTQEWLEKPTPELALLQQHLSKIITEEKPQLLQLTTWRKAQRLKITTKEILNQTRRDRAIPVVEQYQWMTAATAIANPIAALDLVAAAAINGQMIVDLSGIYQQKISLDRAQTIAATLGKLMVKLGLVEISTQTIGAILKSNAFTYIAGGAIQGISGAYLTRIAGLTLIEYYQEQEINSASNAAFNFNSLKQKLQTVFQQNQRTVFLQNFVKQTLALTKA